jgi:hypothetical protein
MISVTTDEDRRVAVRHPHTSLTFMPSGELQATWSGLTTTVARLLDANSAWARANARWSDPVTAELADDLSARLGLPRRELIPISTVPGTSGSIRIEHFAMSLLEDARQSSPENAVQRLAQFLSQNTAEELEVVAVWGLEPSGTVQLHDGISIRRFSSLPSSRGKEQLELRTDNPYVLAPKPQAALVREFTYGPIVRIESPQLPASHQRELDAQPLIGKLVEIVKALTLITANPVAAVAYWYQAATPTPLINIDGGGAFEALRQFSFPAASQTTIGASQIALITAYLGLSDTTKAQLRIPLERLNSAKLHLYAGHNVDCALDLGIALEALLCADEESVDISYRFKTRGAILKGGDLASRQDTSAVLGAMYELRSRVAHGKTVTRVKVKGRPQLRGEGIRAFLVETIDLAIELLRIVIRQGSVPNWDSVSLTGDANGDPQ